jgi:hypothetical protein
MVSTPLDTSASASLLRSGRSVHALHWAARALTATCWISAALFGLYILAFYAAALVDGNIAKWNETLPRLYESHTPAATAGIGVHFAAGGIILALGCIQFVEWIRSRYPAAHRWIGRVYVTAAFLAGIGGLTFIAAKGTIGGMTMDVGFGIYGVLTAAAAVETYRHARARRLDVHRAWAMRLFALAIGSWLYRMEYGFWFLLADGAGHAKDFSGPFDKLMAFFFYVPNLLVVEALIRAPRASMSAAARWAASAAFTCATLFLVLGTYYFTKFYWGPAILARIGL